jgi:GNAT superfamily N-acetyltransferase
VCQLEAEEPALEVRRLGRTELSRVAEIDRRERINVRCDQRGTQLVARHGNWTASTWDPDGHGEHSVEAKVHELQHYVDNGGRVALGALASGRLVGIGVVVPHLRSGIAQLAFLHVSAALRAKGIGSHPSERLEQIARTAGDSDMVVSATPSENTVRFHLGRGLRPLADPLAELFELEPEDVHMRKMLLSALRTSTACQCRASAAALA